MRYRENNTVDTFNADMAQFISFIGTDKYHLMIGSLARGLNVKGYVTPIDDLVFSLERQLANIELLRIKGHARVVAFPEQHLKTLKGP
jgi:hypothetical protein